MKYEFSTLTPEMQGAIGAEVDRKYGTTSSNLEKLHAYALCLVGDKEPNLVYTRRFVIPENFFNVLKARAKFFCEDVKPYREQTRNEKREFFRDVLTLLEAIDDE